MSIDGISSLSSANVGMANYELSKSTSEVEDFSKTLDEAYASNDDEELKEACQEFEAYFIQKMYKSMQSTIDDSNSLFQKSQATKTYIDFLVQEQAEQIACGGGIGIADMMYDSMKAQQVAADDPINENLYK